MVINCQLCIVLYPFCSQNSLSQDANNCVFSIFQSLVICNLLLPQKTRRPTDVDSITPQALQKMCENILYLLTTTVDVMEPVSKVFSKKCTLKQIYTSKKCGIDKKRVFHNNFTCRGIFFKNQQQASVFSEMADYYNLICSLLQVLWPYLLECLVPEPFTHAMNPLCRCICHLATKKREEQTADFTIDFDVKSK